MNQFEAELGSEPDIGDSALLRLCNLELDSARLRKTSNPIEVINRWDFQRQRGFREHAPSDDARKRADSFWFKGVRTKFGSNSKTLEEKARKWDYFVYPSLFEPESLASARIPDLVWSSLNVVTWYPAFVKYIINALYVRPLRIAVE